MRLSRREQLESRIRDVKRQLLHQHDKLVREIWKSHIEYLENEIKNI